MVTAGDPSTVWLSPTREYAADIDALAELAGGRVGLRSLLDSLGSQGRRARRGHAPGRSVRSSLTWDRRDRVDRTWWPQGVSTSADAELDGAGSETAYARRVVAVAWYSKRREGTRISFLDLDTRRYTHALLVAPRLADGVLGVEPVHVHAGGLVWRGPWLHVAATGRGLVSAHVEDLVRVPVGGDGRLAALGHDHLLPVRSGYRSVAAPGTERLRHSYLSLDRSGPAPALLVGEYARSTGTKRLARFALDDTGLLTLDPHSPEGRAHPETLVDSGVGQAQGAVWAGGRYHLSTTVGTLYAGHPGAFAGRRVATPPGPEDLSWWPSTDRIWTVTEVPWLRWVLELEPHRG